MPESWVLSPHPPTITHDLFYFTWCPTEKNPKRRRIKDMKISGEVAVVVGAAREGIGKGYCKALLDKGAKVLPV